MSPAALARAQKVAAERWVPDFLSLTTAIDNSRKNQTYNTPALATLVTLEAQIRLLNESGGMDFAAGRTAESASLIYRWAEAHRLAEPFVQDPQDRSNVIAAVDFDESVDAAALASTLRANGIVDAAYRKLGRNQLRVATFVATPPEDVSALLACIDYVLDRSLWTAESRGPSRTPVGYAFAECFSSSVTRSAHGTHSGASSAPSPGSRPTSQTVTFLLRGARARVTNHSHPR